MTKTILICEGTAEKAILDILLDNNCLKINRTDLLYEKIIDKLPSPSIFCQKYLSRDFGEKINVFIVLDSLKWQLSISEVYHKKIQSIEYYITRPEIEAIQLEADGNWKIKYQQFSGKHRNNGPKINKPSTFFKESIKSGGLGIKNIKKYEYVYDLWVDNPVGLCNALMSVKNDMNKRNVLKSNKGQFCLADLLK